MDCLLPAVFAALSGAEAVHPHMLLPPPGVGGVDAPPPAAGKATYGEPWPESIETANFIVAWNHPDVELARADAIADQLEAGWTALVEEQGWPMPVSADRYRIWVFLDPEMHGSGFSTVYTDDNYPEGYPVLYVNPEYEPERRNYALSVAVHELGHAIQYRLRDWGTDGSESWYWEASAEWMAELGAPDLDMYALSSWWYILAPTEDFDSVADGHQYGMVFLNAWMDAAIGPSAFQEAWIGQAGAPWEEVLETAAGRPFDTAIVEATAAFAAGTLRDPEAWYPPEWVVVEEAATERSDGRLGSWFYEVPAGMDPWVVEGDAIVTYLQDGVVVGAQPTEGGYRAVVTTPTADGRFTYDFVPLPEEKAAACGCGATGPASAAPLLLAAWLTSRRRRAGADRPGP